MSAGEHDGNVGRSAWARFGRAVVSWPSLVCLVVGGALMWGAGRASGAALATVAISVGMIWLICLWRASAYERAVRRPNRQRQATWYRRQLDACVRPEALPQPAVRDHLYRREQLDRVFRLEHHLFDANADTPGGITLATPMVLVEVRDLANQAYELGLRRVGLIRGLRSTSEGWLLRELEALNQRIGRAQPPLRDELTALLAMKRDQLDAYRRLSDELAIADAQLDSIETFLCTLSYDQSTTVGAADAQFDQLKTQIAARRQAVAELQRVVAGARS